MCQLGLPQKNACSHSNLKKAIRVTRAKCTEFQWAKIEQLNTHDRLLFECHFEELSSINSTNSYKHL